MLTQINVFRVFTPLQLQLIVFKLFFITVYLVPTSFEMLNHLFLAIQVQVTHTTFKLLPFREIILGRVFEVTL